MNRARRFPAGLVLFACLVGLALPRIVDAQAKKKDKADDAATREYVVARGFQKKKLYEVAAGRWVKFLKDFPKDQRAVSARHHLGVCQLQLKQYPQAAATFGQLLTLAPKYKFADRVQYNIGLCLDGRAAVSNKPADFATAAAAYGLVATKYPKSTLAVQAIFYQAECLYAAGDAAAAVGVYTRLLTLNPPPTLEPNTLYGLGTTQQELKQYAPAVTTYTRFLAKFAKHPQATEVRLRLGLSLYEQKKYAESEPHFAAVAAVPAFPQADLALLQQAHALRQQQKLVPAAVLFESLPKKFAKSSHVAESLLAAGKCRFEVGEFVQARIALAAVTAIPKAAELAEASYWLARTLVELKQAPQAVALLDAAVKAHAASPLLPQLVYARVEALYAIEDRRAETVAQFSGFAAKYPKHTLAANAVYMASLAALQVRQYDAARTAAGVFLANQAWQKHALLPEVLNIGGQSWLRGEKPDLVKSEALFRRIQSEFSKHVHAKTATVRIGYCLYRAGKYDPAVALLSGSLAGLKDPPLVAEAQLLIGRSHFEAGRPAPALTAFRASLTVFPKWERADEVLYALGVCLKDSDQLEPAAVELGKLNQQYATSAFRDRAFYHLGDIARRRKMSDQALAHFGQVVTKFPKSVVAPLAQYGIGAALYEKQDYQAAAAALGKLTTGWPTAAVVPRGRHLRGTCFRELKQFTPAAVELAAFLAAKPDPAEALDARFELALCQIGLKQHPQAITTLTLLLKDKPDYGKADSAYYELAFAYEATKQMPQAIAAFRQLVTIAPKSPLAAECWFRLGRYHEESGDAKQLPEAEKAYTTGLKQAKRPEIRESLLYQLAWVQYRQERPEVATVGLATLLKEFPKGTLRLRASFLSGECLFLKNKWTEALPMFAPVIAEAKAENRDRALYRAATCHMNLKQWPNSQAQFALLIKDYPKYPQINEARYGLGWSLQNQKKLGEAVVVYQQVTKATNAESAAKSRFMIGECAFAQKKFKIAYQHFLETAFKYPYEEWQAKGYFEAGRCFIELKQFDQARSTLETVIEKFPKRPEAKNAMQLLANLKGK